MTARAKQPWFEVRESAIQGRGVFAARRIPKGTWIVQYTGISSHTIIPISSHRSSTCGGAGIEWKRSTLKFTFW